MFRAILALIVVALLPGAVAAQGIIPRVVSSCGTVPAGIYVAGGQAPPTVDTNGNSCTNGSGGSSGSSVQIAPGTGLNATVVGNALAVVGPTMTFQGTLAVTTSAALSTLTLSNGTTWPATLGKLTVINVGAGSGYICWFGGTCAATGGSELLAAGASDTIFLGAATTSPTAFSAAGTTLAIHN